MKSVNNYKQRHFRTETYMLLPFNTPNKIKQPEPQSTQAHRVSALPAFEFARRVAVDKTIGIRTRTEENRLMLRDFVAASC
jgi:hypothetical protein